MQEAAYGIREERGAAENHCHQEDFLAGVQLVKTLLGDFEHEVHLFVPLGMFLTWS